MSSAIEFLLAEAEAFAEVLKNKPSHEKKTHVPIQTAEQFNALLERARADVPEISSRLPGAITWDGFMAARDMGITPINYTDLEIKVMTVLAVLRVAKAGH